MFIFDFDEKSEKDCTDFCSYIPDIVFGFPFYKACKYHDFHYRGRKPLGNDEPLPRSKADMHFLIRLLKIVNENSKNFIHRAFGILAALVYYIGVRICGWISYDT